MCTSQTITSDFTIRFTQGYALISLRPMFRHWHTILTQTQLVSKSRSAAIVWNCGVVGAVSAVSLADINHTRARPAPMSVAIYPCRQVVVMGSDIYLPRLASHLCRQVPLTQKSFFFLMCHLFYYFTMLVQFYTLICLIYRIAEFQ